MNSVRSRGRGAVRAAVGVAGRQPAGAAGRVGLVRRAAAATGSVRRWRPAGPAGITVGRADAAAGGVERDPAVAREVHLDPGVGVAVATVSMSPVRSPGRKPWTSRVGIGLSGLAARSRIAIVDA